MWASFAVKSYFFRSLLERPDLDKALVDANIDQLSQALGQVFPAASEESDGIQKLVQQIQSKVAQTVSPQQPQAPPI